MHESYEKKQSALILVPHFFCGCWFGLALVFGFVFFCVCVCVWLLHWEGCYTEQGWGTGFDFPL